MTEITLRFDMIKITLADLLCKYKDSKSKDDYDSIVTFMNEKMLSFIYDVLSNDNIKVDVYEYLLEICNKERKEISLLKEEKDKIIHEGILDIYTMYGIPSPNRSMLIASREPQSSYLGDEIFDNLKFIILKHFETEIPFYFNNALQNGNFRLCSFLSEYIDMDHFLSKETPIGKYILIINSLECFARLNKEMTDEIISLIHIINNLLKNLEEDNIIEMEIFLMENMPNTYNIYNKYFLM